MIEYIIAITLPIIFGTLYYFKKNSLMRTIFFIFVFGYLTYISAFRGTSVGIDTEQYKLVYGYLTNYGIETFNNVWSYEPGFSLLYKIAYFLNLDFQWILILTSVFINVSFALFINKYSKNITISSFIYAAYVFPRSLNIMRQFIAIAILIWMLKFIFEKKFLRCISLVIIAYFFHESAIFLLPLTILSMKKIKFSNLIIYVSVFISIIVVLFYQPLLELVSQIVPRYASYVTAPPQYDNGGSWKIALLYLVFAFFSISTLFHTKSLIVSERNPNIDSSITMENNLYRIIISFFIFFIGTFFLSAKLWIADRIYGYFIFSYLLVVPEVISRLNFERNLKYIVYVIFTGILFYYAIKNFNGDLFGIFPYEFCWE